VSFFISFCATLVYIKTINSEVTPMTTLTTTTPADRAQAIIAFYREMEAAPMAQVRQTAKARGVPCDALATKRELIDRIIVAGRAPA
jgi:hypothetical protein